MSWLVPVAYGVISGLSYWLFQQGTPSPPPPQPQPQAEEDKPFWVYLEDFIKKYGIYVIIAIIIIILIWKKL